MPLLVLAGSGRSLPGLPDYRYQPLIGDSFGYYAAVRELVSSAGRPRVETVAFALAAAAAAAAAFAVHRRGGRSAWRAVPLAALAVSLWATGLVAAVHDAGAPTIGWPLVWAVPLAPLRIVGGLDPDTAFSVGLVLSLAANAAAVVGAALIGLRLTGSRAVGLGAAALLACWPLLARPLAGPDAWSNGQWLVDVGLALYSEPLSTALVTVAVVILLGVAPSERAYALAGALLGLATATRLSNGAIAATLVVVVLLRTRRGALALAAGGLAWLPLVIAYWPKSYYVDQSQVESGVPAVAWGLRYTAEGWTSSLLFGPRTLVVLLPLLVLGALAVRRRQGAPFVLLPIVVTAVLYTPYRDTDGHPRFLYVVLPLALVLVAAAIAIAAHTLGRRSGASTRT